MMLTLQVFTDPVAKARARTTFHAGKVRSYTPRKTEEAEWRIRQQFMAEHPGFIPLTGAILLTIAAYVAMPLSIPKKRRGGARPVTRPDIDNYAKTVLDALNGVAFKDDSQVVSLVMEKRYAVGYPPRWEIVIDCIQEVVA